MCLYLFLFYFHKTLFAFWQIWTNNIDQNKSQVILYLFFHTRDYWALIYSNTTGPAAASKTLNLFPEDYIPLCVVLMILVTLWDHTDVL